MLAPPKLSANSTKVSLARGYGLMGWVRLTQQRGSALAGTNGKRLNVTADMMRQHDKDWMIINGEVYNVGPYMAYHPGGNDELLRATGCEGTAIFNEIHPWVNYTSMLKACYVGPFVGSLADLPPAKSNLIKTDDRQPVEISPDNANIQFEDKSTDSCFKVLLTFTAINTMSKNALSAKVKERGSMIRILVRTPPYKNAETFEIKIASTRPVKKDENTIEVMRVRENTFLIVASFADVNDEHIKKQSATLTVIRQPACDWSIFRLTNIDSSEMNKNELTLTLKPVNINNVMYIPIGHHIFFAANNTKGGEKIVRPFTPVMLQFADDDLHEDQASTSSLHLLIKLYENGKMSDIVRQLKIGDKISISDAQGYFDAATTFRQCKNLVMLAAGSGLTPFPRIISHWRNVLKRTKPAPLLLYFVDTIENCLWYEKLRDASMKNAVDVRLYFSKSLTPIDDHLPQEKLRLNDAECAKLLLTSLLNERQWEIDSTVFLICGPVGFNNVISDALTKLRALNVYIFKSTQ